jgi:putative ABC transport system permease protein
MLPLSGSGQTNFVVADGNTRPRAEQPSANFRFVAPEFFRTLGVAMRRGRSFTDAERDPARPAPVVISEPLAARLWPGRDPIGQRFSRGLGNEQGFEVVGVAADAHVTDLDQTPPFMVYVPYWWRTRAATSLMLKTASDPASVASSVRRAVQAVDPEIAVGEGRALDDLVSASMSGRRYQTQLFVVFGAVALFIATVGVYGTTTYSVTRRRREMNIRVALGARPSEAIGMVVRQEALPVGLGIAGGLAGAAALGGVVASLLFEVRARDPWVLLAVASVVGLVGLGASLTAARQGLTLDPAAALREE